MTQFYGISLSRLTKKFIGELYVTVIQKEQYLPKTLIAELRQNSLKR